MCELEEIESISYRGIIIDPSDWDNAIAIDNANSTDYTANSNDAGMYLGMLAIRNDASGIERISKIGDSWCGTNNL